MSVGRRLLSGSISSRISGMTLDGSIVLQVVALLIGAGAAYGGIRADIKAIHERLKETADKLHHHIEGHP